MRERDERVLHWIGILHTRYGYPPSLREIARNADVSQATAHTAVESLTRCGLVRHAPGIARSLYLTEAGREAVAL